MSSDFNDESPALDASLRSLLEPRLEPAAEDDAMIERVRRRVLDAIATPAAESFRTVRAGEPEWECTAPGVERRTLWISGAQQCFMLRLAPGAVVHAHVHPADEECLVLEGSVRIGADLVLRRGDFHVGRKGSLHEEATSDTGALLYLRGAVETCSP